MIDSFVYMVAGSGMLSTLLVVGSVAIVLIWLVLRRGSG